MSTLLARYQPIQTVGLFTLPFGERNLSLRAGGLSDDMTFLKTLSNSLMSALRMTSVYYMDVVRQNTPPDERDVEAIEQTSAVSEQTRISDRPGKLSRLNILVPVVLGMLEILPSIECDVFLSSF